MNRLKDLWNFFFSGPVETEWIGFPARTAKTDQRSLTLSRQPVSPSALMHSCLMSYGMPRGLLVTLESSAQAVPRPTQPSVHR